jgi:site-specific DNA recombinase
MDATIADVRTLVYLRQSKDSTGEGLAIARQRKDCLRKVADRGWHVIAEYVDNDVSASSTKPRPAYQAMLAAIEAGEADAVVVWDLDRLTRRPIEIEHFIDLADRHKIELASVGGDVDLSTDNGRMYARIKGAVARAEVERKSRRQKAATLQAAESGKRVSGRRPLGYDDDGVTVREVEATAVRDGYDALISGVPLGEIARDWNRRGLTTGQVGWKTGAPGLWRRDNVRVVLRNPRYIGKRAHLDEIIGDAEWPALVDETTWHAAKAVLDDPSRLSAPRSGKLLLTGIALCGVCGATVHGGGGRYRGVTNYRCSGSMGHVARMAKPVDDYVSAVIIARLSLPDAGELLVDHNRPNVEALRSEAVALRSRLDTLADEFAVGSLTITQIRKATDRVRGRLDEVESQMADAGRVDVLGPLIRAGDMEAAWLDLSIARKRLVIDTLAIVRIFPPGRGTRTFRPESVDVDWRKP